MSHFFAIFCNWIQLSFTVRRIIKLDQHCSQDQFDEITNEI
jgi:hypothetical protein